MDEIDTGDLADKLFNFAVTLPQGDEDWRIEERERVRKTDNATVVYWNFRARKSIKVNGKRTVPYRKGGKYVKR